MTKKITLPDGTTCYSAPNCRKHFPRTSPASTSQVEKNYVKISKTLSYLLRHKPETAGLNLSSDGWVNIEVLVNSINYHKLLPYPVTVNDILYVEKNDSKKRYTVDNGRIRAAQGHSTNVDLKMEPVEPPLYLYHGTSEDTVAIIQEQGLKAMSRTHVHLSADLETAKNVGSRHGKPRIFKVKAQEAHASGIEFYKAENGVWLTKTLPSDFLTFDSV